MIASRSAATVRLLASSSRVNRHEFKSFSIRHLSSSPTDVVTQKHSIKMSEKSKNPGLAAAAEALIEAASLEADSVTQKQLLANLDSLKTSFDSNLNKVVQKMDSSNENFDAKINTLDQRLVEIKSEIRMLKKLMEEESKQKTLERARALTELRSFVYYDNGDKNSSDLAKSALEWFSIGYGYRLPKDAKMKYINDYYTEECEQSKKEFRDSFTTQIKVLIKHEPRLKKNDDDTWTIFDS
eukprot:scaffold15231_cov66-Cyclotella_meneghiniana.AAC.12